MPHIPFVLDFAWGGVFSSTKDGLPYIGQASSKKNIFFSLGYGGNGIIFSLIAAETILAMISGQQPKAGELFSFNRT